MTYLTIKTPTIIDLREIFTLGLTSKRGSDKIGHKGSGLKFTLALLHRLGSKLEIWTPGAHWESITKSEEVRGITHDFIYLTDGAGNDIPAHIAMLAGADTWTEPWYALREILQNVIDEGGTHAVTEDPSVTLEGDSFTIMQVRLTEPLLQAMDRKDEWFQPRHAEIIYEHQHKGFYYHGFCVYSQPEWRYAYDVTTILERDKLSEDRQLRNADMDTIFTAILKGCAELPDCFYEFLVNAKSDDFTQDVTHLAQRIYWSGSRRNPDVGGFKMAKLERVFQAKHGNRACFSENHDGSQEWYYAKAAGYDPVHVIYQLAHILYYSSVVKRAADCLPGIEKRLVAARSIQVDAKDRLKRALKICAKLRPPGSRVEIVSPRFPEDKLRAGGMAVGSENKVLVLQSFVEEADEPRLIQLLIEEFMHLASGAGDCSEEFQRALIAKLAEIITPKPRTQALVF